MHDGIGDRFQQETKYRRDQMSAGGLDWASQPETYKRYSDRPEIALPQALPVSGIELDRVLRTRRSVRHYTPEPVTLQELSYLLWASNGIQRRENGWEFRTVPSAGALYPIETYLAANRVENLAAGVYHYNIAGHSLEQLKEGDYGSASARAALGQSMCAECAVVFVWTAVFERCRWKYKQRAYRYVYLDAGHVAQNLALAAAGLGLGTCQIGAIFDDEANEIVGVDGTEESVVYMSAVGRPAR